MTPELTFEVRRSNLGFELHDLQSTPNNALQWTRTAAPGRVRSVADSFWATALEKWPGFRRSNRKIDHSGLSLGDDDRQDCPQLGHSAV
jgi:hypothetical protein